MSGYFSRVLISDMDMFSQEAGGPEMAALGEFM